MTIDNFRWWIRGFIARKKNNPTPKEWELIFNKATEVSPRIVIYTDGEDVKFKFLDDMMKQRWVETKNLP